MEEFLKQERRRAATVERKLEQSNFSVHTSEKGYIDEIKSLKEKTIFYRQEIAQIGKRLEETLNDSQIKLESQQIRCLDLQQELRNKDMIIEDLEVIVDNLSKKSALFKEQSI